MRLLQARNGARPQNAGAPNQANGQTLRVQTQGGVPTHVEWRGRVWRVESVEAAWCIEGRWWLDAARQGARRRCFRVGLSSTNGQTLWLDIAHQGGDWRAQRIAD